jgi:hypothetical protein
VIRRLFNLLAIVSFLLFVAAATLWARQYHRFVPRDCMAAERGAWSYDRAVQAYLDRYWPPITFDNVSLSDVFDFMRDVSGANLDVNWKALAADGISPNQTIRLQLRPMRFSDALALVVDSAGIAYSPDRSVLCVSTRRDLRRIGSAYRHAWSWPSDEDLQVEAAIAQSDYGASSGSLQEMLTMHTDRCDVPIDVEWDALRPLGLTPQTAIKFGPGGRGAERLELLLRHMSIDHDIQYEIRNARLLIAPREWFDKEEASFRRALLATAVLLAIAWLSVRVLVRRLLGHAAFSLRLRWSC